MICHGAALSLFLVVTVVALEPNYADLEELEYEDDLAADGDDWNYDSPEVWRWNVEDFPHPQLEPLRCRRTIPSNVCNPDQVLTMKEARSLDAIINSIYNDTSCICQRCDPWKEGIQIGIAVLKHTYMPYNEMPSKIVQSFARNLRSKWRLGDCDDDILIVLMTEDKLSYTDVGLSTSRYISKEKAYSIFLENRANFTQRRFYTGLRLMLEAYQEAAKTIPRKITEEEIDMGSITGIVFAVLLFVALIAIIMIWIYRKRRKTKESKGYSERADIPSSTWRRKLHLSPASFLSQKDDYKPCSTEDDHQTAANETAVTEIAIPEDSAPEQHPAEDSAPQPESQAQEKAPAVDQPVSEGSSDPPKDSERPMSFKTFHPDTRPGMQVTDL